MGSKQVLSDVTVTWDDTKYNQTKKNVPRVRDGGKRDIPRSNNDEFTPVRIIVDLKLDLGDTTVSEVALDNVHLQIAYSGATPTIGWWNGAKWVKFKQVVYAHNTADITLPSPWPTDPAVAGNP
jgi:hypothetical protein